MCRCKKLGTIMKLLGNEYWTGVELQVNKVWPWYTRASIRAWSNTDLVGQRQMLLEWTHVRLTSHNFQLPTYLGPFSRWVTLTTSHWDHYLDLLWQLSLEFSACCTTPLLFRDNEAVNYESSPSQTIFLRKPKQYCWYWYTLGKSSPIHVFCRSLLHLSRKEIPDLFFLF